MAASRGWALCSSRTCCCPRWNSVWPSFMERSRTRCPLFGAGFIQFYRCCLAWCGYCLSLCCRRLSARCGLLTSLMRHIVYVRVGHSWSQVSVNWLRISSSAWSYRCFFWYKACWSIWCQWNMSDLHCALCISAYCIPCIHLNTSGLTWGGSCIDVSPTLKRTGPISLASVYR